MLLPLQLPRAYLCKPTHIQPLQIYETTCCNNSSSFLARLNKCPAFNSLHNKVLAWRQGFIAIRAARLSPSLVQVSVQPEAKLSTETRKKERFLCETPQK